MAETSTKPYMIRALYEWCCDNGYTPYLAVAVDSHTVVPRQHVKGGEIVLNVSPMATNRLTIGNEMVEFQARFSGVAQQISVPVANISAIYARETGHGMAFDVAKTAAAEEGEEADADGGTDAGSGMPEGAGAEGSDAAAESAGAAGRARGIDADDADELGGEPAAAPAEEGGEAAASSAEGAAGSPRKRAAKGQAGADVIAFARSGSGRKKGAASRSRADDAGEGASASASDGGAPDDEPPPEDGGGKGSKARLTRVK